MCESHILQCLSISGKFNIVTNQALFSVNVETVASDFTVYKSTIISGNLGIWFQWTDQVRLCRILFYSCTARNFWKFAVDSSKYCSSHNRIESPEVRHKTFEMHRENDRGKMYQFVNWRNELKTVPFTGDGEVNALAQLITEIKVATQLIVTYCLCFCFQGSRTDADCIIAPSGFEFRRAVELCLWLWSASGFFSCLRDYHSWSGE
jgi:hypothetical protein